MATYEIKAVEADWIHVTYVVEADTIDEAKRIVRDGETEEANWVKETRIVDGVQDILSATEVTQ
jgi:hypothetical protein